MKCVTSHVIKWHIYSHSNIFQFNSIPFIDFVAFQFFTINFHKQFYKQVQTNKQNQCVNNYSN